MLIAKYLLENPSLPIKRLCSSFNLARSSFYAAKAAKMQNDQLDHQVWKRIQQIWQSLPGIGYRKLAVKLAANGKKVLRILKQYRQPVLIRVNPKPVLIRRIPNLLKLITKALTKHPDKLKRGNWILRDGKNKYRKIIEPTRPYQLWAGDWKELKLPLLGVTLYIFVIIDCYTRKLMGWELSIVKDSQAAVRASQKAIETARKDPLFDSKRLLMHTDQGSAYLGDDYILYWKMVGAKLSTADRGKPTQNPYIEAFFSILARFWLKYHELLTVNDARQSLTKFFKLYNRQWPHSGIHFKTPNQMLEEYRRISKLQNSCPKIGA